ncbi:MAG: anaerobic ribonucleoside-triphosphate reductase activating protein [Candidatus Hermodarchaeota archaeon]
MHFGGFQKFSVIDYPGKLSAIAFTYGCNLRCPYCHNPELVRPRNENTLEYAETEIIKFMDSRVGKLDALVITGGEPTLQTDLEDFIRKIKQLGFLVKLDTNGTRPEVLKQLLGKKLLDYVAMDIKAPFERYQEVTRSKVDVPKIKESITLLKTSKISYEFRTTVVRGFITLQDIKQIGKEIDGASLGVIQNFAPTKCLDNEFLTKAPYSAEELEQMKLELSNYVKEVIIRE